MKTYEKILLKLPPIPEIRTFFIEAPTIIDAYLTDLDRNCSHTSPWKASAYRRDLQDLENCSAGLHDIGIHPRSQARILSGIRSFFRFSSPSTTTSAKTRANCSNRPR